MASIQEMRWFGEDVWPAVNCWIFSIQVGLYIPVGDVEVKVLDIFGLNGY